MGKRPMVLKYNFDLHEKVLKWLNENANIKGLDKIDVDEQTGEISLKVPLDLIVYQ